MLKDAVSSHARPRKNICACAQLILDGIIVTREYTTGDGPPLVSRRPSAAQLRSFARYNFGCLAHVYSAGPKRGERAVSASVLILLRSNWRVTVRWLRAQVA